MVCNTFLFGLAMLVSPLMVSAFLPAVPIHNCSGEAVKAANSYQPYFASYGPQLTGMVGWEQWTFVLPDQLNQSMFHFQWTRGNPASPVPNPISLDSTFSVYYQKTGFRAEVKAPLVSKVERDTLMSISIADNVLLFDGSVGPFGVWNVSVNIQGFQSNITINVVAPDVPFEPFFNGNPAQLVPEYHVSHPVYRGHTDGVVVLPNGDTWVTHQVATLKHVFSALSIQSMLSSYTRLSTFVGASSLNWYTAVPKNAPAVTSAQFVYGSPDLSELDVKYQTSNEPSILTISGSVTPTSRDYSVMFAGCATTGNAPYVFNSTSQVYLGAIQDSAGGKTEYWTITTNVLFNINGQPWTNDAATGSLGMVEVYTAAN